MRARREHASYKQPENACAPAQNVDPRLKKIWNPGSRVALNPFWPSRHRGLPLEQIGETNCGRLMGNPKSMRIGPTGVEYRKPSPTVWEK